MRIAWLLLTPLLLVGCATATEIRGPQGQVMHLIECPGLALSMGTCFDKANSLCSSGYTVLDSQQALGPVTYGLYGGGQTIQRHIVVQCSQ
jgi:hypothetical protein